MASAAIDPPPHASLTAIIEQVGGGAANLRYLPEVPSALRDWLQACPDAGELSRILSTYRVTAAPHACGLCEDTFPRAELRENETNPFPEEGLICRGCWASEAEYYNEGTAGDPRWRPPPWPENFVLDDGGAIVGSRDVLYNGKLFGTRFGICIGRAEGFNPRTRYARRVTLDAFSEGCAEAGTVPPEHRFFSDCGNYEERLIPDEDEGDTDGDPDEDPNIQAKAE